MGWAGPILDNHMHLHAGRGRGVDAARSFANAGGTHLLVVNLPSWTYGVEVREARDFRVGFDATVAIVEEVSRVLPGRAWAVLGVHPAIVSRLLEDRGMNPADAERLMCAGIDEAVEYVERGDALALKSGRPHYPVSERAWDVSNAVLRYAFERAADCGCAIQLHTESRDDLTEVTAWATEVGLPPKRVVKHYASGPVSGPIASVIARPEPLEAVVAAAVPFLMETDFLDDPDRPGAVLGPKTVPRRVAWLSERGETAALERAHVDTPSEVYEIELTHSRGA